MSFPANKPKFFLTLHLFYVPFATHGLPFCGAALGIDKRHGAASASIFGARLACPVVRCHTSRQVRRPTCI